MTSFPLDHPENYAFEALPDRAIVLKDAQIQQAQLESQTLPPTQAWQSYCDRLAYFGVLNWLEENNIPVSQAQSDAQSDPTGERDLVIRDFTVRSQFVSAAEDEFVTVSRSALRRSQGQPAHFYVLATVAEEQGQVWVSGFLSHAQMQQQMHQQMQQQMQHQLATLETAQADPIEVPIEVPIDAFNPKLETLLLALKTLEAAPLAAASLIAELVETAVASAISGAMINPVLPNLADRVTDQLVDRIVNLRAWVSRQWEDTVESLEGWDSWGQPMVASALRGDPVGNTVGDLPQILQSLARKGIRLADSTQGLSRILPIAPIPLRLYVIPSEAPDPNEWELLVVLESASDEPMPSGLMLRIRDDEGILLEQTFDPQATSDRSLFAEVVSGMDESVSLEIVLPNGTVHALPKFVFQAMG